MGDICYAEIPFNEEETYQYIVCQSELFRFHLWLVTYYYKKNSDAEEIVSSCTAVLCKDSDNTKALLVRASSFMKLQVLLHANIYTTMAL